MHGALETNAGEHYGDLWRWVEPRRPHNRRQGIDGIDDTRPKSAAWQRLGPTAYKGHSITKEVAGQTDSPLI